MTRRAVLAVLAIARAAAADSRAPVTRPEATEVDRDTTPPGRAEFGFDGGGPVGAYAAAVQLGYLDEPLRLHTGSLETFPIEHRETVFLGGAVALGPSVVVDARLPLAHQVGRRWRGLGDDRPLDRWVLGDLVVGARLRVAARGPLSAFLRAAVTVGTGDDSDFAGEAHWTAAWLLIGRAELAHGIVLAATAGIRLRDAEVELADRLLGDELVGAVGAAVAIPPIAGLWCEPDQLRVTAELAGIEGDQVGGQHGASPAEARLGVIARPLPAIAIAARVGFGLDDQIGAPRVRAMLELTWHAPPPAASPIAVEPDVDDLGAPDPE